MFSRVPVLVAAFLLVVAACSATSERGGQRTPRAGAGPEEAAGSPIAVGEAEGAQERAGGARFPGRGQAPAGPSGAKHGTAAVGGAAAGARTDPIRLGYVVMDTTGVAALTGSTSAAFSDPERNSNAADQEMQALVRWANKTGGVGGRKIEASGMQIPATSTTQERTQACVTFTEDRKVSVVIDHSIFLSEENYSCFAKHKTTLVGVVTGPDRQYMNTVSPYIATTWATLDRSVLAMVQGLHRADYFKGAKLGVVLYDEPTVNRVYDRDMLPALRAIGATPADVAKISGTTADPASLGPQAASAVLRFKNEGITHVVMVAHILVYLAFTNQAESQGYRPRYGFGDSYGLTGVAAFYGLPSQNRDSLGVSVCVGCISDRDEPNEVNADLDRNDLTPGQRRCLDTLSAELGKDYYKGNSGRSVAYPFYCDHFFLWLEAARKVGAGLVPEVWGQGLAALGASYQSAVVHDTAFPPGRFDGASTYRVGKYSEQSKVYVAITPWLPLEG